VLPDPTYGFNPFCFPLERCGHLASRLIVPSQGELVESGYVPSSFFCTDQQAAGKSAGPVILGGRDRPKLFQTRIRLPNSKTKGRRQ